MSNDLRIKTFLSCSIRKTDLQLVKHFRDKVLSKYGFACLRKAGLQVRQQHGIKVHYDGVAVGEYTADLLVEGVLLLELKAVKNLDDIHLAQCLNYLKATNLRLCLLMNFAKPKLEVRRIVNNY